MSFSFTVQGETKMGVLSKVTEQLNEVVSKHPAHAVDRHQHENSITKFVGILADDPARDVSVIVTGSVYKTDAGVQQVTTSISAGLVARAG